MIGLYEFYRALSNQHKPFQIIGLAAAILYYGVLLFREEWVRDGNFGLFFFIGLFWILMVLAVFSYPERRTEDVALTFAGVLYVPVLFSFVYFLRQSQDGMLYAPYIFWAAWGSDTCAYFVGRALGRHKLVPKLSPKKTVEGAIGGVVGALAICLLYGGLIHSYVEASLRTVLDVYKRQSLKGIAPTRQGHRMPPSALRSTTFCWNPEKRGRSLSFWV